MPQSNIRNFCIIAHVDHGKSTLADRLLEMTGTVKKRDMQEQILDSNPIERERGITIKLAPVRMIYRIKNNESRIKEVKSSFKSHDSSFMIHDSSTEYILNLIDTPGHVDFNYEVSRSLAACEGAILVVDATQGVQAQTLANLNLARKQNLTMIPVLNKIDLPNANIERTRNEIHDLGFRNEEVIEISAKLGTNVEAVLDAVVQRIPAPYGSTGSPLRALIFSSQYDTHKGVVVYVRVVDGEVSLGNRTDNNNPTQPPLKLRGGEEGLKRNKGALRFLASGAEVVPIEIGYFTPQMKESERLLTGEVGYIATGLKDVALAKVGDTITLRQAQGKPISNIKYQISNNTNKNSQLTTHNLQPLPGYQEPKPMVFVRLFPIQSEKYPQAREAFAKLCLSDSAFTFKPVSSLALGNGFHCGFLGLLHAEVTQERLSREFGLNLLATAPTVEYRITLKRDTQNVIRNDKNISHITFHESPEYITIQSAAEFPDPGTIEQTLEPVMEVTIFSPKKYTGNIMTLCQSKRAEFIDLDYQANSGSDLEVRQLANKGLTLSGLTAEGSTFLAKFTYLMPLSEMIIDFFDSLKSATEGYASLDYSLFDYQQVELVKLDILLNHEKVDAFSQLVVREKAVIIGRMMVEKLKDVIPKQQFAIPIQAAIGGEVIARSDVRPFRKDVTQKLYGGDRTRKDKLLEAQKKGKKKMKQVGRVEIPQEAFLKVFKAN